MDQPHKNDHDLLQLEELLGRIAQGQQDALAEFYRRTSRAAYACALSLLRSPPDAQDLVQDTYLRVWRTAGQYRPGGRPMGWLLTLLRNLAYMKLRSDKRQTAMDPADLDQMLDRQPAVTSEDRVLLRTALLDLNDAERQIVLLHAAGGLKHREIADLMGLPLGTVLSRYRRALKKMHTVWEES